MNFLLHASKIWPIYSDESVRFVRVKNQVFNVTNRQILLRAQSTIGPRDNGLYHIDMGGNLVKVNTITMGYPDVELLEPDFDNIKTFCGLDKQTVFHMIEVCREIRSQKQYALLTEDSLRPHCAGTGSMAYPFKVYPNIIVNAEYLEIALCALRDLDPLYLSQENRPNAPLIVGINWGNCALIMPIKTYAKDTYGQYV